MAPATLLLELHYSRGNSRSTTATNSSGKVSKAFSVKKTGKTYYRWSAASTTSDRAGVTGKQKVVVK